MPTRISDTTLFKTVVIDARYIPAFESGIINGAAVLVGFASMVAAGRTSRRTAASLIASGNMNALVQARKVGAATFSGDGSINASARVIRYASIILETLAALEATARRLVYASAIFDVIANIYAAPEGAGGSVQLGEVIFSNEGLVSAAARKRSYTSAIFNAASSLDADARRMVSGAVDFLAGTEVAASARKISFVDVTLATAGILSAVGLRQARGAATFSADAGLIATPTPDSFDPSGITGYAGWYVAEETAYGDGDAMDNWVDALAIGPTLTHYVIKPLMETGGGLPYVKFSGGATFRASAGALVTGTAYSIYMVFNLHAASGTDETNSPNIISQSAPSYLFLLAPAGPKIRMYHYIAGSAQRTPTLDVWQTLELVFNGTTGELGVDGAITSGTMGTFATSVTLLMFGSYFNNLGANIDIEEMLFFKAALGSTDRAEILAYLNGRRDILNGV